MDLRRVPGTAAFSIALALAAGCTGTPFEDDTQIRTPYQRYQVLRGQSEPKTISNSFGQEQPNLRARLAPPGSS